MPSAAHAEAADAAKTADTAIHAQAASDSTTVNGYGAGCATGTRLFAGACWELRTQAAALLFDAVSTCGREGGELPSALTLKAFGEQAGIMLEPEGEWAGEIATISSPNTYSILTVDSTGRIEFATTKELRHFRCVLPLLH